jgi:hypothetical protein
MGEISDVRVTRPMRPSSRVCRPACGGTRLMILALTTGDDRVVGAGEHDI